MKTILLFVHVYKFDQISILMSISQSKQIMSQLWSVRTNSLLLIINSLQIQYYFSEVRATTNVWCTGQQNTEKKGVSK